jgi:hypothetical protein
VTSNLTRPSVFGVWDGIGCYLGVVLGLTGHPDLVMSAAAGVGSAEMVFMAGGEWQSDSSNGLVPSLVIGVATGLGAIIPALPYGLGMPGWYARGWSIGLILAMTAAVAWQRRSMPRKGVARGLRRAAAESYGMLAAAAVIVAMCVHFTHATG